METVGEREQKDVFVYIVAVAAWDVCMCVFMSVYVCVCVISYGNGFKEIPLSALISYSLNLAQLSLSVFMCSSAPVIASMSMLASMTTSCNECPSQFFTDMGACTTGENNQLVLHEEDHMTT